VKRPAAPLRVGVIGLGVGEQHALAYARDPGCRLTVLCDRSADQLTSVGRRFPGVETTARPEDVLESDDIDVISIATYDDAHAGQVLAALDHGKHVFAEKPLCLSLAEARRIRAALEARPDLRLSSNLILRRSPRFAEVRRRIRAGEMGRIFHVEGDYDYGRIHKITDGWRGRQEHYSVVLGGAVHMVDTLLWLTGERVTEVCAFGNNICSAGSGTDFDDMVVAILRFAGGLVGKVTANFGCVRPHGHGLAVYGTQATFVNGDPLGRWYASRDPGVEPEAVETPHPGAAKGDLIESFVRSILEDGAAIVTAEDTFLTMSVCLAIERSAREGTTVGVEYV
jgi:predicted dehydrogenase